MIMNRYKIVQIIGEGATSTVYRAQDILLNKEVAIKASSLSNRDEINILKSIHSENTINIVDCIVSGSKIYIIMDFCEYDLISFINDHFVDLNCIKKIMRMIFLGLKHLHDRKIIHRDIKLGNILVKDGSVKICDFGLSCFEQNNDFAYCGTKDYLAPEIIEGLNSGSPCFYDNKIDIYAAGIIFKVLISRRKDSKVDDLSNIDETTRQFIKMLLENDPNKRLSVDQALKHRIFNDLFADIPDFRLLKAFNHKTKYGEVIKEKGYAEVVYLAGKECMSNESYSIDSPKFKSENISRIKLEYYNDLCDCRGSFTIKLIVNGILTDREYLTDTNLKYYNYLLTYLRIICDKTPKTMISDKDYEFTWFLSGLISYTEQNIKILYNKENYIVNGKNSSEISESYRYKIKKAKERCLEYFSKNCICGNTFSREAESTINLSLSSDKFTKEYEYIVNLGWCIKEKLKFVFLLNEGSMFSINALDQTLIFGRQVVPICRSIDSKYKNFLKVARNFLVKFAK